jgi:sirohydrochlorin cobaltochelatase
MSIGGFPKLRLPLSADFFSNQSSPATAAYLLVSHGSRDPRPQVAIDQLAQQLAERTHSLVKSAVLELGSLPLHQQIQQFAEQARASGYRSVKLLPLFLLQGVHVMEDIPMQVKLAQQQLKDQMPLEVCSYLGSHPALWKLLIYPELTHPELAHSGLTNAPDHSPGPQQPALMPDQAIHRHKILIAHGSRRPGSQAPVEAAAAQLNALPAYWSVAPGLETQVTELVKQGVQRILILPYFLFEGSITDAIAQTVEHLGQQFPYTQLQLNRPFGATPEQLDQLTYLVLDLLKRSPIGSPTDP